MTSERADLTGIPRRASLEVLRAEASEELGSVVFERLRNGGDPWNFMDQLPTVDELVVLILRAELIGADNHRKPSYEVDYGMLRQIALAYPDLSSAVWSLLSRRVAPWEADTPHNLSDGDSGRNEEPRD